MHAHRKLTTVRRWLRQGQFPERKPPYRRLPKVNEFADYLHQRWNEAKLKQPVSAEASLR
jgi:hypothetical protein